ncbi:MAG: hypothetical protein JW958_01695 [Candidatus Eisenbacteria bacterium]|nr:hypothetical protein [Candidatus Eisenbacteria bacterium]
MNRNGHIDEKRIQEILEEAGAEAEELRHLEGCPACRERLETFRSLFVLLDDASLPEPPPHLEGVVCARLFPARSSVVRRFRRPIPAWAWAAASIVLMAGSAFLYRTVQVAQLMGDNLLRWALSGDPGVIRLVLRGFTALLPGLSRAVDLLKEAAGYASVMSRTVSLAAQTTEVRTLLLASAGLLVLVALGWGTRFLLAHNKGGHHGLLCV